MRPLLSNTLIMRFGARPRKQPGLKPSPNPENYATKVYPLDDATGAKVSMWVPHSNAKKPFIAWNHKNHSVVHALAVFKNKQNRPLVRFLLQTRPALGGVDTVEAIAGKYGDGDEAESAKTGIFRELTEESGLVAKKVMLLSEDEDGSEQGASIASSPGITNERNAFALILAEDVGNQLHLTENEKQQNVRQLDVPLGRILNPRRFIAWRAALKKAGILMSLNIPALRGLLPGRKTLRAFLELGPEFSAAKN